MSRPELEALAAHLGTTPAAFARDHCRPRGGGSCDGIEEPSSSDAGSITTSSSDPDIPGYERLRAKTDAATGERVCWFLDTATSRCLVYEARPVQCATYPYWPEIMARHRGWEWERGALFVFHICVCACWMWPPSPQGAQGRLRWRTILFSHWG